VAAAGSPFCPPVPRIRCGDILTVPMHGFTLDASRHDSRPIIDKSQYRAREMGASVSGVQDFSTHLYTHLSCLSSLKVSNIFIQKMSYMAIYEA
jgi:hypothetical protein